MYRFKSLFSPTHLKLHFGSRQKVVLPPELSTNVVRLTCDSATKTGVSDVFVIGTIHEYSKCIQDVRAIVKFLKPKAVFLELCSDRVCASEFNKISSKYKIKVNFKPDQCEFQAAIDEAYECGAKIILGDRRIQITRKRFDDKFLRMPFLQIMKIILRFIIILPTLPDDDDDSYNITTTSLAELNCKNAPFGPFFNEIYVDERDQYMSAMLLKVARKHKLVVAVVGKGHLLGIQKYWTQPIEVEHLLSTPSKPLEMKNFTSRVKLAILNFFHNVVGG